MGRETVRKTAKKTRDEVPEYRINFIFFVLLIASAGLIWRILDLQVVNNEFLQGQGNARVLRQVEVTAHRGMITDRNGYPLAISTPVDSIWVNPKEFSIDNEKLFSLAKKLQLNSQYIKNKIIRHAKKEFIYIKRRIDPNIAKEIVAMNIKGVHTQREYRRYYPDGEIFGHVLGFTDVDDNGQEGMELAYNNWLTGQSGSKQVIKDRLGQTISIEEQIKAPEPGNDLALSLERRIQYLAYTELKNAVEKHNAKSGSIVVLDIETGEILAMANQPSFNPNRSTDRKSGLYRNRAVTDLFEPGSTMKPISIAAALSSGRYSPSTMIDTGDGWFMIKRKTIKDSHAYGKIDVATVLQKSSNVGTSKIALSLPKPLLWDTFYSFGFGSDTGSGFPGESSGRLVRPRRISKIEQATLSFGYGLSVTNLQLTNAYSMIARLGKKMPISFLSQQNTDVTLHEKAHEDNTYFEDKNTIDNSEITISQRALVQVSKMMETVVQKGGTAPQAAVKSYKVAGKTGTVKKTSIHGGYTKHKYSAVFAGFAPASHPKIAIVVMIDEPSNGTYYGGLVAAPVFSKVMSGALRLFNIDPDAINLSETKTFEQIEQHIRRQG